MAKIKKKSHWSRFLKPLAPIKPREPNKEMSVYKTEIICSDMLTFGTEYSLLNLNIPDGVDFKDITFVINKSGCDDYDCELNLLTKEVITTPNPAYELEYKLYKKSLIEYEERKKNYKEELSQWTLWKKQEEDALLQKKLQKAENLLKKHGKK